jgi:hypothetical protein
VPGGLVGDQLGQHPGGDPGVRRISDHPGGGLIDRQPAVDRVVPDLLGDVDQGLCHVLPLACS